MPFWDDGTQYTQTPEEKAAEEARKAHTAANFMSREDFLKKYGIGPGGTFVADDKGGNAASEVAGQSAAEYYDNYLAKTPTMQTGSWDNPTEVAMPTPLDAGKYSNINPYFDWWDNVDPHPESQLGNGLDEFWRQVGRPVAAMAAFAYGGNMIGNALGSTGAAAAGGPGSAGWGMDLGTEAVSSAAPTASTAAATGGPGSAGWGMDLGTDAVSTFNAPAMAQGTVPGVNLSSIPTAASPPPVPSVGTAGWGADLGMETGVVPKELSTWDKLVGAAKEVQGIAKQVPIKQVMGGLKILSGVKDAINPPSAQPTSPLATYAGPANPVKPYDWQKIQIAANRAGVPLGLYVAQNQQQLNMGIYP